MLLPKIPRGIGPGSQSRWMRGKITDKKGKRVKMMIGFNGYSTKYTPFSACQVQPIGWLKNQLKIQAEGLNGNLDKVWPDVRDSQWIGGKAEGWIFS